MQVSVRRAGAMGVRVTLGRVTRRAMSVAGFRHVDGGQMQVPVPHSGFRDQALGKGPERTGRAAQQSDLKTILVVKMNMQR